MDAIPTPPARTPEPRALGWRSPALEWGVASLLVAAIVLVASALGAVAAAVGLGGFFIMAGVHADDVRVTCNVIALAEGLVMAVAAVATAFGVVGLRRAKAGGLPAGIPAAGVVVGVLILAVGGIALVVTLLTKRDTLASLESPAPVPRNDRSVRIPGGMAMLAPPAKDPRPEPDAPTRPAPIKLDLPAIPIEAAPLFDRLANLQPKTPSPAPAAPPKPPRFTFASVAVHPVVVNVSEMADGKLRGKEVVEKIARIRKEVERTGPGLTSLLQRSKAFQVSFQPEVAVAGKEGPPAAEAILTGEVYEDYDNTPDALHLKMSLIEVTSGFPVWTAKYRSGGLRTIHFDDAEFRKWMSKMVLEIAPEVIGFAAEKKD